jgi:hypothetical protein
MKKTKVLLLPHSFKKWGWICVLIGVGLMIQLIVFEYEFSFLEFQIRKEGDLLHPRFNNFTNELMGLFLLIGFFFLCFSAHKEEDEMIWWIRLNSWKLAMFTYMSMLLIGLFAFYDVDYLNFVLYNMLTPMVVFLIAFHSKLYLLKKSEEDEE